METIPGVLECRAYGAEKAVERKREESTLGAADKLWDSGPFGHGL